MNLESYQFQLPPSGTSRRASTSSSSSNDFPSSSSRPQESAPARLRRLKAELAEVEADLASRPSSSSTAVAPTGGKRKSVLPQKQPVNVMSQLASLRERLVGLNADGIREDVVGPDHWRDRLGQLIAPVNGEEAEGEDVPVDSPPFATSSHGAAGLADLDKRLAQLEDVIGPPSSGPNDVSAPTPSSTMLKRYLWVTGVLASPPDPRKARSPPHPSHSTSAPRRHLTTRQAPTRRSRPRHRRIPLSSSHGSHREITQRHPIPGRV